MRGVDRDVDIRGAVLSLHADSCIGRILFSLIFPCGFERARSFFSSDVRTSSSVVSPERSKDHRVSHALKYL